jgi:hypothetical protein
VRAEIDALVLWNASSLMRIQATPWQLELGRLIEMSGRIAPANSNVLGRGHLLSVVAPWEPQAVEPVASLSQTYRS